MLVLEDLHWADPSTRDFLTFLVRSARTEPLALIATYRSDEMHRRHPLRPVLAELERAQGVERLGLDRFSLDEVEAQLTGDPRRAARPASPSACTRAARATRSTPRSCSRRPATGAGRCPRRCATRCSPASSACPAPPRRSCASPPSSSARSATACSRRWRTSRGRADARRARGGGGHVLVTRDEARTRSATRSSARPSTTTCCRASERAARRDRGGARRATRGCSATLPAAASPPSSPATGTPPTTCRARSAPPSRPGWPRSACSPTRGAAPLRARDRDLGARPRRRGARRARPRRGAAPRRGRGQPRRRGRARRRARAPGGGRGRRPRRTRCAPRLLRAARAAPARHRRDEAGYAAYAARWSCCRTAKSRSAPTCSSTARDEPDAARPLRAGGRVGTEAALAMAARYGDVDVSGPRAQHARAHARAPCTAPRRASRCCARRATPRAVQPTDRAGAWRSSTSPRCSTSAAAARRRWPRSERCSRRAREPGAHVLRRLPRAPGGRT